MFSYKGAMAPGSEITFFLAGTSVFTLSITIQSKKFSISVIALFDKQSYDNNFLEHQNYPMMPRQHPISNIPITSHSQHQPHRHHRFKKNNYSQPPYHRQPYYHRSHAPQEHLVHVIRKIIREENQYQPRR